MKASLVLVLTDYSRLKTQKIHFTVFTVHIHKIHFTVSTLNVFTVRIYKIQKIHFTVLTLTVFTAHINHYHFGQITPPPPPNCFVDFQYCLQNTVYCEPLEKTYTHKATTTKNMYYYKLSWTNFVKNNNNKSMHFLSSLSHNYLHFLCFVFVHSDVEVLHAKDIGFGTATSLAQYTETGFHTAHYRAQKR